MTEKVILKKYANRRIYDTERSAYITLEEVGQLIRAGRQVSVLDAKTSEDVTAFILSQIITEEAKNKNVLLPVPFLHLVIQHGEMLSEFFEKHLQLTMKNYLLYKAAFDEQFRNWLDVGKNFTEIAQRTMPYAAQWESMFDLLLNPGKKAESKDQLP